MAERQSPVFEPLTTLTNQHIDDMAVLAGVVSSSFRDVDVNERRLTIAHNLEEALACPEETAVFVHEDNGRIISTATANIIGTDGWVDDVATLESAQGRGLATGVMRVMHGWMQNQGAERSLLTSKPDRIDAWKIYRGKFGYTVGGTVYRAPITDQNSSSDYTEIRDPWPEDLKTILTLHDEREVAAEDMQVLAGRIRKIGRSEHTKIAIGSTSKVHDFVRNFVVEAGVCKILTGNKAWISVNAEEHNSWAYRHAVIQGNGMLKDSGVKSANMFFTEDKPADPDLEFVLKNTGFEARDTGLFVLDLTKAPTEQPGPTRSII
ncbi:hypothetical protein BH10PAT3_BH10PAT3_4990 [soil metagenome]